MNQETATTPLGGALKQFGSQQHLCSIYESKQEHFAVGVQFIKVGLDRGERCLYIADDDTAHLFGAALRAEGIDVERALATTALVFSTKERTYLRKGAFDPQRMFDFWKNATGQAMTCGFTALRAIAETDWVLGKAPGVERWMEYENRLTQMMASLNCTALCQYDRHLFPPETILDVIRTHPTVIYRDTVGRNMYHVPRDEYPGSDQGAGELDRQLNNIRDREQVESMLREQRNELRRSAAILAEGQRISHTGSWICNVASRELFWSEEHFRIFGLDPQTAQRSYELFFQMIHHDDREVVRQKFENAVRAQGEFDQEYKIVRPDDTVRHIHSLAHPVWNGSGGPVQYVGTVMDITERKHAEEKLLTIQAELARVSRVVIIGELTASIAHEVNQPLAAVITNSNAGLRWLDGTSPNLGEARNALSRIARDGLRASQVIAGIRSLLRKTGKDWKQLDCNELIVEVVGLVRGELRNNAIALRTELAADLPPLCGDRGQLQQLVLNLIMNGIESMSAIKDRVRELVISTQRQEGNQLCIAVQDSGTGMDQQAMKRVFDAFFTTKPNGMGIGLSISRAIVEAHGGRLWALRNEGPGTTFRFALPGYDPGRT